MARLPITRTQRSLPGTSSGVRTSVDAGSVGRAIANLGAVASDEVEKWNRLHADTQFSEAKRAASLRMGKQLNEELAGAKPEDYEKIYNTAFTETKAMRPRGLAGRDYDKLMNASEPIWSNGVSVAVRKSIAANAKASLLGDFAWAEENNNPTGAAQSAQKLVSAGIWSESEAKTRISKVDKEARRQQMIDLIDADPKGAMAAMKRGDLGEFTPGQQEEFENKAINAHDRNKRLASIFGEEVRGGRKAEVSSYLSGDEESNKQAIAAIDALSDSDEAKDKKLSRKMARRKMARDAGDGTNTLVGVRDTNRALADYLGGETSEDEAIEELQVIRFDKEGSEQSSYETTVQLMKVYDQVPPEVRSEVRALLRGNEARFFEYGPATKTTLGPAAGGGQLDFISLSKANKALVDWMASVDPKELTHKSISEMNDQIVEWTKKGLDPGEMESNRQLTAMMESEKLPTEAYGQINKMLDNNWTITQILEGLREAYPDANN